MSRIAIVDPGSGNLASLVRALARAAEIAERSVSVQVTTDTATVAAADRILLPGQGAFAACRAGLDAIPGMVETLETELRGRGKPFLGICVGMQLMAERGLEHGETPGLGWFRGEIAPLRATGLPLPQMGWNTLDFVPGAHPLLDGVSRGAHAYFVHSYGLSGHDFDDVVARTDYGGPVVAMIARGNLAGTQFHVEKSGLVGLRILANFLAWEP
jgi:glutamine amidotransferase